MNCICCATKFDASCGPCPRCAWNPNAVHRPLAGYEVGEVVKKRYIVRENLGRGRLGVAVKAIDKEKNRPVTLKFIHPFLIPDDDAGMRFLTAMNALKSLGDEHLVNPIEAARDQGHYFIARPFLVGVSLRQLMDDQRICGQVFPADEAMHIVERLARSLVSVRGGSHGAFAPSKIWVLSKDIKIVDYGLASALPSSAVWHGLKSGPGANYLAPEHRDNHPPDPRGDVFALGVLLGELLSLAEFDGDPGIFRECEPDLSREMEALIRCSLSLDPDARYSQPMEFVSALYDITGRARSVTMPPDKTAVVPVAFLNQLRSMSQVPPPDDDDLVGREVTKQVRIDSIAESEVQSVSTTPPNSPVTRAGVSAAPPVVPSATAAHSDFKPPPFRPTDLGALARANAPRPADGHRAPPPMPTGRKSILPAVPSPSRPLVPKPDDMPAVLKSPPAKTAPPAPRPSMPPPLPQTVKQTQDEISALKALMTPRPAVPAPRKSLIPVPSALKQASAEDKPVGPESSRPESSPPQSGREPSDSVDTGDRYEGINPRFLRAAAKLEKARVSQINVESKKDSTTDEEDWRRQLEESSAGSVISFLPPTTIDNPKTVEGFPNNRRSSKPQIAMRPARSSAPPPPPPIPRPKRK